MLCPFSADSDYIETSKLLVFTGDAVQHVSIQIVDDGTSEPPETFFGVLSGADGTVIPPNIHLEPTRATATIISGSSSTNSKINNYGIFLLCYYSLIILCRSHRE
jgi:hypothetical protein